MGESAPFRTLGDVTVNRQWLRAVDGDSGFLALKFTPSVPNFTAAVSWGVSWKTSLRHVSSNPSKPASVTTAASSASSRAPAIQPVQRSMSLFASSGISFCTMMSASCKRPPGFSTLYISP